MALKPEDRYKDVEGFIADLEAFLDDATVGAFSESPLQEVSRFVRKNRGAVLGTLASCAALIFGTGSTFMAFNRQRTQRVTELLSQASAASEAKRWSLARELYSQILGIVPDSSEARLALNLTIRSEQESQAAEQAELALKEIGLASKQSVTAPLGAAERSEWYRVQVTLLGQARALLRTLPEDGRTRSLASEIAARVALAATQDQNLALATFMSAEAEQLGLDGVARRALESSLEAVRRRAWSPILERAKATLSEARANFRVEEQRFSQWLKSLTQERHPELTRFLIAQILQGSTNPFIAGEEPRGLELCLILEALRRLGDEATTALIPLEEIRREVHCDTGLLPVFEPLLRRFDSAQRQGPAVALTGGQAACLVLARWMLATGRYPEAYGGPAELAISAASLIAEQRPPGGADWLAEARWVKGPRSSFWQATRPIAARLRADLLSAESPLTTARRACALGDYERAERLCLESGADQERDPESAAWQTCAWLAVLAENKNEARRRLQSLAEALDPSPQVHILRGELAYLCGDFELAHSAFLASFQSAIQFPQELFGSAFALARLGRSREALERLKIGLRHDGRNIEALALKAQILADNKKLACALGALSAALRVEPENVELLLQRARIFEQLSCPDEAIWDLDAALALAPEKLAARLERAALLEHQVNSDDPRVMGARCQFILNELEGVEDASEPVARLRARLNYARALSGGSNNPNPIFTEAQRILESIPPANRTDEDWTLLGEIDLAIPDEIALMRHYAEARRLGRSTILSASSALMLARRGEAEAALSILDESQRREKESPSLLAARLQVGLASESTDPMNQWFESQLACARGLWRAQLLSYRAALALRGEAFEFELIADLTEAKSLGFVDAIQDQVLATLACRGGRYEEAVRLAIAGLGRELRDERLRGHLLASLFLARRALALKKS